MQIDKGIYTVLRSVSGAYSCRRPPVPSRHGSHSNPYVALLIEVSDHIHHIRLGESYSHESIEEVSLYLQKLPEGSVVEVCYDPSDYKYYRKDQFGWTKVGEAQDPFFIEVFNDGRTSVLPTTDTCTL